MKRIAIAVALAAGAGLSLSAAAQTKSVKVQSTWPASLTIQDHLRILSDRVDKLTSGQVKIEVLAAGQIVPPFEVLDATSKKVIDGWHSISYYWVGKNPAAALFSGPPGGPFGMDHMDYLGWLYVGGGLEMWREFYQNDLKLVGHGVAGASVEPAGLRLVQEAAEERGRLQGHEVPADRPERRDLRQARHERGEHGRRRDRAGGAARRDRLRRVGRRRRGPAPRPAGRVQVPLHPGHAREQLDRRVRPAPRRVEVLHRRSSRRR